MSSTHRLKVYLLCNAGPVLLTGDLAVTMPKPHTKSVIPETDRHIHKQVFN